MKRVISCLLTVMLLLTLTMPVAMATDEKTSGAFTYRLKGNGTAAITGYDWKTMNSQDIYIPRMLDGYVVTEIDSEAFATIEYDENGVPLNRTATNAAGSLVIPDTVKTIGEKAFWGIDFATKAITIPQSVEHIGAGAFSDLNAIEQFSVVSGNPVYTTIDGVLYSKREKMLVSVPAGRGASKDQVFTIPEGIKHVEDYACWGALDFEGIVFPSTLETIGEFSFAYTFSPSSQIDLVFPASLKQMKKGAFYGCNAQLVLDLSKAKINEISSYAFARCFLTCKSWEQPILFPAELTTIGEYAFSNCSIVGSTVIPSSVVEVKSSAFRNSEAMITFASNSELQIIGDYAFSGESAISVGPWIADEPMGELLSLPTKLEIVGTHAFDDQDFLAIIVIPPSVKSIGEDFCDRSMIYLDVEAGSYAALYASENGYMVKSIENDTSWLND